MIISDLFHPGRRLPHLGVPKCLDQREKNGAMPAYTYVCIYISVSGSLYLII